MMNNNREQVLAGQTIVMHTDSGREFRGYVAGAEDAPRGILVLHEWWGLKEHNRDWVDRFANEGYRSLVLDLFDGRVTDDAGEAGRWMQELDQQDIDAKLVAGLKYLKANGRKIATFGCSLGGRQAMRAALLRPDDVYAVATVYSRMETDHSKLKSLKGPVLAIYAEQEKTWPDKQEDFEAAMDALDKVTESVSFDAPHGFIDPGSPNYDPEAEAMAWGAILAFFNHQL